MMTVRTRLRAAQDVTSATTVRSTRGTGEYAEDGSDGTTRTGDEGEMREERDETIRERERIGRDEGIDNTRGSECGNVQSIATSTIGADAHNNCFIFFICFAPFLCATRSSNAKHVMLHTSHGSDTRVVEGDDDEEEAMDEYVMIFEFVEWIGN